MEAHLDCRAASIQVIPVWSVSNKPGCCERPLKTPPSVRPHAGWLSQNLVHRQDAADSKGESWEGAFGGRVSQEGIASDKDSDRDQLPGLKAATVNLPAC